MEWTDTQNQASLMISTEAELACWWQLAMT